MKKNVISLAVAASVSALAMSAVQAQDAMYVNKDGTGEVLLFPFYDAENGNATNFHVVNTTDRVKAVKVRFLEYKASIEVLDFNLYLSPQDHFAFGVVMDENGTGGSIVTTDNSCTVPALGSQNGDFDGSTEVLADGSIVRRQPFTNYEFVRGEYVDADIERTLRGHVEIIEMGVLSNGGVTTPGALTPAESQTQIAAFATHGADGVPANCAGLQAAFGTPLVWAGGVNNQVSAPAGGLYGLAYHINVEDAAAWGFEPTAIADWSDTAVHALPGDLTPSLGNGNISSIVVVDGVSQQSTFAVGIDAVSSLMMTTSITNDVMTNAVIGGQTDWVTTFPTKRDYVVDADLGGQVVAPFTEPYLGVTPNAAGTAFIEVPSCEGVSIQSWDREEQSGPPPGLSFSPRPEGAAGDVICDEQHVAAWGTGADSALNVERGLFNLPFAYTEGWSRWTFVPATAASTGAESYTDTDNALETAAGGSYIGLPAIGFGAYKYANGSAGNVMMNYGHAAEHKTNTVVSGVVADNG